ncbi:MAG: VanZ-like protein [Candidatus Amesbacteria bacterium GW2011_GWA2_47_11b]|uniref:VanZ-like protein n=3 Tax=Candidatus Amesiibacteriota TaxID=1752730 RepID=A0A0G1SHT5_9BACT|nr:MAG: VanZ-like protein [Microgenomates group bacterium GW2011_GWC1_46_20]KKU58214.1 MAG: VanZ-like protein [Candidatus Amesbacteria bacterium GW2011_GWA2_47_11b]KKU69007.1 MAG: VanZ-like protein [Candidatus Amesbacteria bacterium GW2011_GWA1_47_20]KKU82613.1 MAG: VanZ-like protein [Candidatus Amesbacteria bacterium GW2011_GWC2_47_8]
MSIRRRIRYWLPTILWAVLIFSFSAQPTFSTTPVHWRDFVVKKSAHLFVYAVLALLIYRSLKLTTRYPKSYLFLFTLILVVLYAVSDEFHQTFSLGRTPTLRDVLIDIVGGLTGLIVKTKIGSSVS